MVSPPAGAAPNTRRALLGGAAAGAAAAGAVVLLSACGSHAHQPVVVSTPSERNAADIEILNQLLDLEYKAIAAYTAGTPLLSGSAHDAAKQFLVQELYHASKLYSMITTAHGTPIKQRANYQLGSPRTHEDVLRLLQGLERAQITAYLAAVPAVSLASARSVLAAILANDAQHDVILRAELRLRPLTGAFVLAGPQRGSR